MTDIHDRLLQLEEEGYRAVAARRPGDCDRIAASAAELDPDHWLILVLCGCADMMSGQAPDAIAQWMAAADRMEDERDMHRMVSETAPVVAEASLKWEHPANMEMAGLMALSCGLSDLAGSGECDLMLSILEAMRGMVSEEDQELNAALMQSGSEVAYTAVMFGTDLGGGVECARSLLSMSETILRSMEAGGAPEGFDIGDLREHVEVRMEAYRQMVSEWDASSGRLGPEEMSAVLEYWKARPQRSDALRLEYMDQGYLYSCGEAPGDLEALRKAARQFVLKWLRIRK